MERAGFWVRALAAAIDGVAVSILLAAAAVAMGVAYAFLDLPDSVLEVAADAARPARSWHTRRWTSGSARRRGSSHSAW